MEMTPIVDGLSEKFEGQISVVQLNAAQEANTKLQTRLGLRGHPSFAVIDADGSVVQPFFRSAIRIYTSPIN